MTSPDGIGDSNTSEYEANEPDPSDLDQTSYPTMETGWDIFLVKSHPVVEDEALSSIISTFERRAFISALEMNVIVRPQGIGGMRIKAVSTAKRKIAVTPQIISKRWGVRLKTISDTIKSKKQIG